MRTHLLSFRCIFWAKMRKMCVPFLCFSPFLFSQPRVESDLATWTQQLGELRTHIRPNTTSDSRRRELAKKILATDAQNALALEEMGIYELEEFKWLANDHAHIRDVNNNLAQTVITFRDNPYSRKKAERHFQNALDYFGRALAIEPMRISSFRYAFALFAYAKRFEDAEIWVLEMQKNLPNEVETKLFSGLIYFKLHKLSTSQTAFQSAFRAMSAIERAPFERMNWLVAKNQAALFKADSTNFIRQFWVNRDPRLLTNENERLLEHWARLVLADLLYRPYIGEKAGWQTKRGELLVRYGDDPYYHLNPSTNGSPRSGTWNFGEGITFDLVDSFFNEDYVFADDAFALPILRETPELADYRVVGKQIQLPFQISTFKGEHGKTDVVVPFGIPFQSLNPQRDTLKTTFQTGVFWIPRHDSTIVAKRASERAPLTKHVAFLKQAAIWQSVATFALPADSSGTFSVEFETFDSEALGFERKAFTVPHYPDATFALSDILLAHSIEEEGAEMARKGIFNRKTFSILPALGNVFDLKSAIHAYFEVYSLSKNVNGAFHYEINATILPKPKVAEDLVSVIRNAFKPKEKGVSVQFKVTTNTPDDAQYFVIDTADQKIGEYLLALRIKDLTSGKIVAKMIELRLE